MHKQLIMAAFEKAKVHAELEGTTNPSKNRLSNILSEYFSDDVGFSFSSKRLRDHFTHAKSLEDTTNDINIAQQAVINGLCHYVGYETYQDFLNAYKPQPISSKPEMAQPPERKGLAIWIKKHKTPVLFVLSTMVLVFFIVKANQQRWMVWNGESFEKTPFESDSLESGVLHLYSKEQMQKFSKLSECDCNTDFFNADGSVKVWYYKSKKGTLECFNSPGLHPETRKTLKPITIYMIRKYLCKDEKIQLK